MNSAMARLSSEKRIDTVDYWDANARWYDLWLRHNHYHRKIIAILTRMARPGWKVVDIGAGGGILSIPLAEMGCRVTCVEPSAGMRTLLYGNMARNGLRKHIKVDHRLWEEVDSHEFSASDLVLACNSIHLMRMNPEESLRKMFLTRPEYTFVVTEASVLEPSRPWAPQNYRRFFHRSFKTESSYVYHTVEEALEHRALRTRRVPDEAERKSFQSSLVFRHGHYRLADSTKVHIHCWKKKGA
jgi:FkbM family methyltransferase